jgi:hypothetical protein
MDIGLQAFQGVILAHMGYPRNWGQWEPLWSSHNLARQFPYEQQVARAELFGDAGLVHVAEARAHAHANFNDDGTRSETPPDYWQRRLLAVVDVSPSQFYCVDFYRISGGEDHWWAFHCEEGDFTTNGIQLTKQEGGTLAGPEVPYADETWMKEHGCSLHATYGWRGLNFVFPHLYNVERGKGEGPWWGDWALKTGEGLHTRLTVLEARDGGRDGAPIQVNITDGRAASGGSPYEMKWIMMHNQGEVPARTQVLSIIEPYLDEPIIQQARPLQLSGEDEAGFSAAACELRLGDRTDTIFWSADPSVERTAEGGFRFAGRFGFYAEKDGQPIAMSLVGGTVLEKNGLGIRLDEPEHRAEIIGVDRENEIVTISPAPANPGAMVGAHVFITNPVRRVAYKVLEARRVGDDAKLALDMDSCIGTGQVTGAEDFRVLTSTPFVLQHWGYYEGARVVSADGTAEYRINEVRSGRAAMIDATEHPEATADKLAGEFLEGTWFKVYDYGVGDQVVWPHAVSLARAGDSTYRVTASAPPSISLPDGALAQAP